MEEKTQEQIDSEKRKRWEEIRNSRVKDTIIPETSYCYNNNIQLKKSGVNIPFTKEQIEEYIKCKNNIIYFLKTYCEIVTLDYGLAPFELYKYQEEVIVSCDTYNQNIFLFGRQQGKTTTIAGYILHEACFKTNNRTAILANKSDSAKEVLERVKEMFELLPWFLKPGVKSWNKQSIELSNGNKIFSAATSSSSIRGKSCNTIYIDEMAFIDNDTEFFTSTYPALTAGKTTKLIITSTPNGLNLFYKMWTEAIEGRNGFSHIKATWEDHPDRDEEWAAKQISIVGQKQFDQEFSCVSGDTIINIDGVDITIGELYNTI